MSNELEAQDTAPENVDIEVNELNGADLEEILNLFYGKGYISSNLLDDFNEPSAKVVAVERFGNLLGKRDFDGIVRFLESIYLRPDLKIIFCVEALETLPDCNVNPYKKEKDSVQQFDNMKYQMILQELIGTIEESPDIFLNISVFNRINVYIDIINSSGTDVSELRQHIEKLVEREKVRLSDPNYDIVTYQSIRSQDLKNKIIYSKIISDLSRRSFARIELKRILLAFEQFARYQQRDIALSKYPFAREEILQIVQFVNKNLELSNVEYPELIRLGSFLVAAEIGEQDYFFDHMSHYAEEILPSLHRIPIEEKRRLLNLLNKCGENASYLGEFVAEVIFDELAAERQFLEGDKRLGHVYSDFPDLESLDPDFFPRLIDSNLRAKEMIIKKMSRQNAYLFDQVSKDLICHTKDLIGFLNEILSKETLAVDLKYSILMKSAIQFYKTGEIESFELVLHRMKYLITEYEYEVESSPITMYAHLTFLEDLCTSMLVKAHMYVPSDIEHRMGEMYGEIGEDLNLDESSRIELCEIGHSVENKILLEYVSLLEEHYEDWSKGMNLFEKGFHWGRLVRVLIQMNTDSVNERVKKMLRKEIDTYIEYYNQFSGGPYETGDEEALVSLFTDLGFFIHFGEIKEYIYRHDNKNKENGLKLTQYGFSILKERRINLEEMNLPETNKLAKEFTEILFRYTPTKERLYIDKYFTDQVSNILLMPFSMELWSYLRKIEAHKYFDYYINKKVLRYLYDHEPENELLKFVRNNCEEEFQKIVSSDKNIL